MPDDTSAVEAAVTFDMLRRANVRRLPLFKNRRGEPAHSERDGSDWRLSGWCNAVTGELGEAANIIKKIERGDMTLYEARQDLADELADVQTYLDLLAFRAGIDLGAATVDKFNRVSDRVECGVYLGPAPAEPEVHVHGGSAADYKTILDDLANLAFSLDPARREGYASRAIAPALRAQLTAEREKREAAENRWADICKDAAAEYREENVYVMAVLHSMFAKYGVDLESQSAPHAETGETTPDKAQGALAKMQERRAFADMAGKAAKETP